MLKCYSYDIVCQEIPDEITLAVNISCCPNRCPGCHSPWLWEDEGEAMTDEMICTLIGRYSSAVTCFCFMGGDSEPGEIERISGLIKKKFPHIKTAWYSGRVEIPAGFDLRILDFIKLGPYIAELGGLKSPKTNQVLYKISSDLSMIKIRMV